MVISIVISHPENGTISVHQRYSSYINQKYNSKLHSEWTTQYTFRTQHTMSLELIKRTAEHYLYFGKDDAPNWRRICFERNYRRRERDKSNGSHLFTESSGVSWTPFFTGKTGARSSAKYVEKSTPDEITNTGNASNALAKTCWIQHTCGNQLIDRGETV